MDYGGSVQGSPAPDVAAGKDKNKSPQEILNQFWAKFNTKKPGKVTSIFPKSLYASLLPPLHSRRGAGSSRNAAESYEAARAECVAKVKRIVRECERTNTKFTDPDFDIESDLRTTQNCLYGLIRPGSGADGPVDGGTLKRALSLITSTGVVPGLSDGPVPVNLDALKSVLDPDDSSGDETFSPGSVHRVDWIFEKPAFTKDGFSSTDIEQGAVGDCWFMAAVATIAHRPDLMTRVCVARDEECGVYGFVFQRDGEWVSTVIDDKLYVSEPDFSAAYGDVYDPTGRKEREYRRRNQRGSKALYFAHCTDSDETWLPLLEKAYAKVHGDYTAISGGYSGEGVEDLTGGVNTVIKTNSVLRKERLWRELENKQGEFVFSLGVGGGDDSHAKNGLTTGHAYTVLQAREEKGPDGKTVRLVQIRNPWGERDGRGVGEWKGAWSDGAKEWTPYWLEKLNYKFGDDGLFWMSFSETLDVFRSIHRTRLFDEKWTVIQQWTSTNVAWVTGYLQSKFVVKVTRPGMVVVVLSQLDDRYFKGLEGQYQFDLHFLLQAQGSEPGEHLCRVRGADRWEQHRSISCEVELEPGTYEVIPKVTATRYGGMPKVEDVVRAFAEDSPQKLRQIGLQYDLAHAKGGVSDEDELLQQAKLDSQTKKVEARRKRREKEREAMEEAAKHMEEAAEELHKAAGKGEKKEGENKEAEKKEGYEKKPVDAKAGEPKAAETAVHKSKKATGEADDKKTPSSQQQQQQQQQAKTKPAAGPLSPPEESSDESEEESSEEEESAEETSEKNGEWKDVPEGKKEETQKDGVREEEIGEVEPAEDEAGSGAGDDDEGSDGDEDGEEDEDDDDDGENGDVPPWNAVCVMGLRVYAQDPDVTISLEKPNTMAEATSLTVAEAPAGATM